MGNERTRRKGEVGRKGPRKKFRWEEFDEEDDEYFYT